MYTLRRGALGGPPRSSGAAHHLDTRPLTNLSPSVVDLPSRLWRTNYENVAGTLKLWKVSQQSRKPSFSFRSWFLLGMLPGHGISALSKCIIFVGSGNRGGPHSRHTDCESMTRHLMRSHRENFASQRQGPQGKQRHIYTNTKSLESSQLAIINTMGQCRQSGSPH